MLHSVGNRSLALCTNYVGRCSLICRALTTSPILEKNIRAAVPKTTFNRSKSLTYEEAQFPPKIGVTKAWNSWNTSNLHDEYERTAETTIEDIFIRKFVIGTWHNLFATEIVIKRRQNKIIIAGLITRSIMQRKVYFLTGYTEELLSYFLKRPVKMEIQCVEHRKDMIFKWI